jgi:hypothetical protein
MVANSETTCATKRDLTVPKCSYWTCVFQYQPEGSIYGPEFLVDWEHGTTQESPRLSLDSL